MPEAASVKENGDASSPSAGPAFYVNSDLIATTSAPIPTAGAWAASYKGEHGPLIKLTQVRPLRAQRSGWVTLF